MIETPRRAPTQIFRPQSPQNPAVKLALEMGPLVAFFITNYKFGIFPATGVLMSSVIIALII